MNADDREQMLAAFDALSAIQNSEPTPRHVPGGHGGSLKCGFCRGVQGGSGCGGTCPVGQAIAAISPHMPRYADRDQWVEDGATASETVGGEPKR